MKFEDDYRGGGVFFVIHLNKERRQEDEGDF
jgi:hypothetical protein